MKPIISIERRQARRRAAMKRWLRRHGIAYSEFAKYNESALRKLVRNHL